MTEALIETKGTKDFPDVEESGCRINGGIIVNKVALDTTKARTKSLSKMIGNIDDIETTASVKGPVEG
jgi:hypothetical protein